MSRGHLGTMKIKCDAVLLDSILAGRTTNPKFLKGSMRSRSQAAEVVSRFLIVHWTRGFDTILSRRADDGGFVSLTKDICCCIGKIEKFMPATSFKELASDFFVPMMSWCSLWEDMQADVHVATTSNATSIVSLCDGCSALASKMKLMLAGEEIEEIGPTLDRLKHHAETGILPPAVAFLSAVCHEPMKQVTAMMQAGQDYVAKLVTNPTLEELVQTSRSTVKAMEGMEACREVMESNAAGVISSHRTQYLLRSCRCLRVLAQMTAFTEQADTGFKVCVQFANVSGCSLFAIRD
jgi:hypothetical protein